MPALSSARGGVIKFLREQEPRSSGTEPISGAERANVFTYHYEDGRGARWQQDERSTLWLLALSDLHDEGYARVLDLQAGERLYPALDPAWADGAATLMAWGRHLDEDSYEWARMIYGALETFAINRDALEAGERVSYPGPTHLELVRDDDEIWTLTIRRRLGYLPPESRRGRWLTLAEIEELFLQIAGRPEREDYDFDNPPHPTAFLFTDVHFLDGPLTPASWLERVTQDATAGERLPLPL